MNVAWNTNLTQEDAEIIFNTFAYQHQRTTNVAIMVYILATLTIIAFIYAGFKLGLFK
jgi:hypothetical protein